MARKLKVFRTAIGFHDAYVAAASRKAALAAWGTDKDLFARGVAEEVTDPALGAAPLARPGEVIRVSRGSAAEQVEALGRVKKAKALKAAPPSRRAKAPKPSDEAVRLAERSVRAGDKRARERLADLARREKALAAERTRVEREIAVERERHEARLLRATETYQAALAEWKR